jgi:hypothetical protein
LALCLIVRFNHAEIKFQNFIKEAIDANVNERPEKNPKIIQSKGWQRQMQEATQQSYSYLTSGGLLPT